MIDSLFLSFFSFNSMFSIVPIVVFIIFAVVFISILVKVFHFGLQKTKDTASTQARVLSKRQLVWGRNANTYYYATFEMESGERAEYKIPQRQIGYLVEGDTGVLTYQGTLFIEFERQKMFQSTPN